MSLKGIETSSINAFASPPSFVVMSLKGIETTLCGYCPQKLPQVVMSLKGIETCSRRQIPHTRPVFMFLEGIETFHKMFFLPKEDTLNFPLSQTQIGVKFFQTP